MSLHDAYEDRPEFEITDLRYEDDAVETYSSIEFEYGAPAVTIDNKGRFVTHPIIGGTTVRQKIGEEPREVTVDGVVIEETARQLDTLRDAKRGTIISRRIPGDEMECQFASVSTNPMTDGGSVRMTDGEFLYTFSLNVVEI